MKQLSKLLCITVLLCAIGGCATHPVTFVCPRTEGTLVLDGVLNEAAWHNALQIAPLYQLNPRNPRDSKPYKDVSVRMLYDSQYLYVGAVIRDRDVVAVTRPQNPDNEHSLLDGDTFEVFLQPNADKPTFYELHVSPMNQTWDARHNAREYTILDKRTQWDADMKTAVRVSGTINKLDEDEGWSLEMAIPFESLTDIHNEHATPTGNWRMAICLYDYSYYRDNGGDQGTRIYITSARFREFNFQRRQDYDWLRFK